jgi:hypothetical protein
MAVTLFLTVGTLAHASYRENDRSADTRLADFRASVFDYLPARSILVPRGRGAFASDVTYWRLVKAARPDVAVLTDPDATVPTARACSSIGPARRWGCAAKSLLVPVIAAPGDLVLCLRPPAGILQ